MSTGLDALLAIPSTSLLQEDKDRASGVGTTTSLGDLRGTKAAVYGELICSLSLLIWSFYPKCNRRRSVWCYIPALVR